MQERNTIRENESLYYSSEIGERGSIVALFATWKRGYVVLKIQTVPQHLHTPQRSPATQLALTEKNIPEAVNAFELRERA